jgi:putative flippase GtrA
MVVVDTVRRLDRRYGVIRAAKFGLAGVVGFLVLEAVVTVGLYALYGRADVPSNVSWSPGLVGLDVLASFIGVTVGFLVNEKTTVRDAEHLKGKGSRDWLVRLMKYQGVYVVGNAITIGVQLALLGAFAVSPPLGNVVGAIVAYPPSYLISMRYVWKVL